VARGLRGGGKKVLRIAFMPARAFVFVSKRLQPPVAAILCIAVMQLLMLAAASCHEEPLPMGAVRAAIGR
jgi:hypothetical protein